MHYQQNIFQYTIIIAYPILLTTTSYVLLLLQLLLLLLQAVHSMHAKNSMQQLLVLQLETRTIICALFYNSSIHQAAYCIVPLFIFSHAATTDLRLPNLALFDLQFAPFSVVVLFCKNKFCLKSYPKIPIYPMVGRSLSFQLHHLSRYLSIIMIVSDNSS